MKQLNKNQLYRMMDLFDVVHDNMELNDPREFLLTRIGRSPSSLEEELVSHLPLFEEDEKQRIIKKAQAIVELTGLDVSSQEAFAAVAEKNPDLGKEMKAVGLMNFQNLMQYQFYEKAEDILKKSASYEFPAGYEKMSSIDLMGFNTVCLEQYRYGGSRMYASMLYHLLRHTDNISGEETKSDVEELARRAFKDKRVLELGCGPGFFLYTLRELGADVTGIEIDKKYKDNTEKEGLNIIYGDVRTMKPDDKKYDIVLSKDFLSLAVTKKDAGTIMRNAYEIIKPGGTTVHQVDYKKMSEELYLAAVSKAGGVDIPKVRDVWDTLSDEAKEMILRKNILNISNEHMKKIGFTPLTSYRLDLEEYITITARR